MSTTQLSPEQMEILRAVLDTLLPPRPEHALGGAGELGGAETVATRLGEATPAIGDALAALDARAHEAGGFSALDAEAREALLRQADPELPGLVSSLVFHGYGAYYAHPRVLDVIGVPGRPPHPEGYPLEQRGLELLDGVRSRTDLCREV